MILDPVGACIQPADLHPFQWTVDAVQQELEAAGNATAETVPDPNAEKKHESEQDEEESEEEAKPVLTQPIPMVATPSAPAGDVQADKRENLVVSRAS